MGFLDADGFLTVTDRTKDLIVTSEGENVSPQRLETALRASPYVAEALVVGHGRPYVVALLSPDLTEIRPAGRTDAEVRRLLGRVVADVNRGAAHAERVRRFGILPRELRAEEGELTPTLKARRHVCEEHFRDLIDSLYVDRRTPLRVKALSPCRRRSARPCGRRRSFSSSEPPYHPPRLLARSASA